MNQADQQSNKLDELITQLLNELKAIWQINDNNQDERAEELISNCLNNSVLNSSSILNHNNIDSISLEEFEIQRKVLAKTRAKTEQLSQQLEALEANLT